MKIKFDGRLLHRDIPPRCRSLPSNLIRLLHRDIPPRCARRRNNPHMRKLLGRLFFVLLVSPAMTGAAPDLAEFKEVHELIRTNGTLGAADLDRAAVKGLLAELSARA